MLCSDEISVLRSREAHMTLLLVSVYSGSMRPSLMARVSVF